MAAQGLQLEAEAILERLLDEAHRFEFFQAVRLMELARPDCTPVGEGAEPEKEPVRFSAHVGFDFPPTDVQEVFQPERGSSSVPCMVTNFFGLAGATGPLPAPLAELVIDRLREKDTGLSDFLDIFNHRLISLLYRIRKAHRVSLSSQSPEATQVARYLFAFLGLGVPGLRGRMKPVGIKDRALLSYAGLLSQHPRSVVGMDRLMSEHFGVPVNAEQFAGAWREIQPDDRTTLGRKGRNQALGQSTVLGGRVWDQQGRICLLVGPLTWEQFQHFLPDAAGQANAYHPLCTLARFYAGEEFEFRVSLKIQAEEVPELRLGSSKLGWTTWLKTRPMKRDSQVNISGAAAAC